MARRRIRRAPDGRDSGDHREALITEALIASVREDVQAVRMDTLLRPPDVPEAESEKRSISHDSPLFPRVPAGAGSGSPRPRLAHPDLILMPHTVAWHG